MNTPPSFFYNIWIITFFTAGITLVATNEDSRSYSTTIEYNKKSRFGRRRKKELTPALFTQENRSTITELPVTCQLEFDFGKITPEDKMLCSFLDTITFTQQGVKTFFEQTFNQKEYGKNFLPHNFSHLEQFLKYGKNTEQQYDFYEGVFRLFTQKFKNAPYIDSESCASFLNLHKDFFAHLFPEQQPLWHSIKKILWDNFCKKFSFFKNDPSNFLEDISQEISNHITHATTTPEKVRSLMLRLFVTIIDKLAWVADDQYETWKVFRSIGDSITYLHEHKALPDIQDCNELYWGLIERYCYFLELNGTSLSHQTCLAIKQDLLTGKVPWLTTKEQEYGITTKAERIAQALLETEAKILALTNEGHLTEILALSSKK